MSDSSQYEGIKKIIRVVSNNQETCVECHQPPRDFETTVNHFIADHGYKVLHIGTETEFVNENTPCHSTVAVLGKC